MLEEEEYEARLVLIDLRFQRLSMEIHGEMLKKGAKSCPESTLGPGP